MVEGLRNKIEKYEIHIKTANILHARRFLNSVGLPFDPLLWLMLQSVNGISVKSEREFIMGTAISNTDSCKRHLNGNGNELYVPLKVVARHMPAWAAVQMCKTYPQLILIFHCSIATKGNICSTNTHRFILIKYLKRAFCRERCWQSA